MPARRRWAVPARNAFLSAIVCSAKHPLYLSRYRAYIPKLAPIPGALLIARAPEFTEIHSLIRNRKFGDLG